LHFCKYTNSYILIMVPGINDSPMHRRRRGGIFQQLKGSFNRAMEATLHKNSSQPKATSSNHSTSENDSHQSFYNTSTSKFISANFVDNPKGWWSRTVYGNIILLLFGPSVRDFLFPKASDLVFDVLLSIAFVVLLFDFLFHCMVDPRYFHFRFRCSRHKWFAIGSTMFWLDLLGTFFILYEISYINKSQFGMTQSIITEAMSQVSFLL